MKKFNPFILLGLLLIIGTKTIFSQGVSVNDDNTDPHPSAMLDVSSVEKGVLIPRMTKVERDAISEPADGLLVFQTDDESGFYYFFGGAGSGSWQRMVPEGGTNWTRNAADEVLSPANIDDRVGIGTSAPQAILHVQDSAVLFERAWGLPAQPDPPPASGSGIRMMWYSDKASFRAGEVGGPYWDQENIGYYSIAAGSDTKASGPGSVAMGTNTIASGNYSTAFGQISEASGDNSTALGWKSLAAGNTSLAMGYFTRADAFGSMAMGKFNVGGGNAISWIDEDPLLELGNGTNDANKHNALTILKNGRTGLGTASPAAQFHVDQGDVLFNGSADIAATPQDPPASGGGVRMMWYPDKAAFRAGVVISDEWDKGNIGNYSVATGSMTKASGTVSTAMGFETEASGTYSTSFGSGTHASGSTSIAQGVGSNASGSVSFASGSNTDATGYASTSMGYLTEAAGSNSTSLGHGTVADSYSSLAIGQYNTGGGSATSWVATDPLFEVGNGTSISNKNNALTILKNGKTGIGIANPAYLLHVVGSSKIESNSNNVDLYLDTYTGKNASVTFQENGSYKGAVGYNTTSGYIFFYESGNVIVQDGKLGVGKTSIGTGKLIDVNGGAYCNGATWYNASDKNLKENFETISGEEILNKIARMEITQWNYKTDDETVKHVGPMAQDFHALFGLGNDEVSISTVDAAGVSLAAIKALNQENEELKLMVQMLQQKLDELENIVLNK